MARQTKLTAKRKTEFLTSLSQGASVTRAAEPVLISRWSLYDHRNKDPEFAAAWDRALEDGVDKLEDEARRRAYEGVDEPVFYKGDECGYVRKYSDTLLIFLLKGARPEKYRDTERVNINVNLEDLVQRLEAARQRVLSGYRATTQPLQLIDNNESIELALDAGSSVEGQVIEGPGRVNVAGPTRVDPHRGPPPGLESETPPQHEREAK